MSFKQLTPSISVSSALTVADMEEAAKDGFRTIIDNRPDNEEAGQLNAAEIAALVQRHELSFAHIPVVPGSIGDGDVARMATALGRSGVELRPC